VRQVVHTKVEPDNTAMQSFVRDTYHLNLVKGLGQKDWGGGLSYTSSWSRDSPSKYLAKSTIGSAGSSRL
jgi:hypothetical protein